jgi:hypothetical protein
MGSEHKKNLIPILKKVVNFFLETLEKSMCSGGVLPRVTILAEWLRHFNDLAVGETAAPACFLRENAEGAGMPPLLSH